MQVVQPSVGDVMVDCFKDNISHSELEARVLKIQPVEILIPSNLAETTERLLRSIALSRLVIHSLFLHLVIILTNVYIGLY